MLVFGTLVSGFGMFAADSNAIDFFSNCGIAILDCND